MPQFPDIDWFGAYAKALESSPDFRKHCRWFKGDIAFRVDGAAVTVGFDDGIITGVRAGMADCDYLLNGPRACWDKLLNTDWTLVRLYRTQEMEIRGKTTEVMKNWKALFWIAEGMKGFAASRKTGKGK